VRIVRRVLIDQRDLDAYVDRSKIQKGPCFLTHVGAIDQVGEDVGSIYRRGTTWWIQYRGQGQLFRESTYLNLKSAATTLLKVREGEISHGRLPSLKAEQTTFDELAALYLQDYQINGRKTLDRVQELTDRLHESFGRFRACRITSDHTSAVGSPRAWPMGRLTENSQL
jgi:hypothetical protein